VSGPEARVERAACRRILEELGVKCLKFAPPGTVGYMDRVALVPGGRPLFLEFKRRNAALEAMQVHRKAELERLGYDVAGPVETVDQAVAEVRVALARALDLMKKRRR
jgi:hypothetical protein